MFLYYTSSASALQINFQRTSGLHRTSALPIDFETSDRTSLELPKFGSSPFSLDIIHQSIEIVKLHRLHAFLALIPVTERIFPETSVEIFFYRYLGLKNDIFQLIGSFITYRWKEQIKLRRFMSLLELARTVKWIFLSNGDYNYFVPQWKLWFWFVSMFIYFWGWIGRWYWIELVVLHLTLNMERTVPRKTRICR